MVVVYEIEDYRFIIPHVLKEFSNYCMDHKLPLNEEIIRKNRQFFFEAIEKFFPLGFPSTISQRTLAAKKESFVDVYEYLDILMNNNSVQNQRLYGEMSINQHSQDELDLIVSTKDVRSNILFERNIYFSSKIKNQKQNGQIVLTIPQNNRQSLMKYHHDSFEFPLSFKAEQDEPLKLKLTIKCSLPSQELILSNFSAAIKLSPSITISSHDFIPWTLSQTIHVDGNSCSWNVSRMTSSAEFILVLKWNDDIPMAHGCATVAFEILNHCASNIAVERVEGESLNSLWIRTKTIARDCRFYF